MSVTIDIDDRVPQDLRTLALLILQGQVDAALPLSDLVMENYAHRQRVTMAYVERLEDTLIELRRLLRYQIQEASEGSVVAVNGATLEWLRNELWRCEVEAKALGRHF